MLIPLGDNLERPNFPVMTVTLIVVNVLIFAITFKSGLTAESMCYDPKPSRADKEHMEQVEEFYNTWGLVPSELAEGNIIGIITCIFLHASIAHLIGNMIILWAFGQSLETALGPFCFTVMYVLWGAIAGVAQCAVDFSSEMPLVGASGAIAGVIGAYVLLLGYSANIKMLLLLFFFPFRFDIPAIYVGVGWFLLQLLSGSLDVSGELSGVAYMAHIGGFLAGVITLVIFRNQTDRVVVRGSSNMLVFKDRHVVEGVEPEPVASVDEVLHRGDSFEAQESVEVRPVPCQFCDTELDSNHRVGPQLLRCPSCEQLNYLEKELV